GGAPGGAAPAPMTPTPTLPPDAGGQCGRLVPVSALSFENLPAAPGARLRVRAELSSGAAPSVPWSWLVTYGDGVGMELAVTALDAEASVVEVPVEKSGHYNL